MRRCQLVSFGDAGALCISNTLFSMRFLHKGQSSICIAHFMQTSLKMRWRVKFQTIDRHGRMRQNNTKGARGDVTGYFPTTTVFDGWFVELVVLCLIFSFPSFSVVCFLTPVCNALDEERFHIMKGKVPFQFVRAGAQREGADGKCSLQTLAV